MSWFSPSAVVDQKLLSTLSTTTFPSTYNTSQKGCFQAQPPMLPQIAKLPILNTGKEREELWKRDHSPLFCYRLLYLNTGKVFWGQINNRLSLFFERGHNFSLFSNARRIISESFVGDYAFTYMFKKFLGEIQGGKGCIHFPHEIFFLSSNYPFLRDIQSPMEFLFCLQFISLCAALSPAFTQGNLGNHLQGSPTAQLKYTTS